MSIPTTPHTRHCGTCDREIPRHRGANQCMRCEGRMVVLIDGNIRRELVGASCLWRTPHGTWRHWPEDARRLELAMRYGATVATGKAAAA